MLLLLLQHRNFINGLTGVPTPRPTDATATPSAEAISSPTPVPQPLLFNKMQNIDGKLLGTQLYLSNCLCSADDAVCGDNYVGIDGCTYGRYLVIGDASKSKIVVYQRDPNDIHAKMFFPILQPGVSGSNMIQELNWTCATGSSLQVNLTRQGAVAMHIDRGANTAAGPSSWGDILAIGSPLIDSTQGVVNIYRYFDALGFVWMQRIIPKKFDVKQSDHSLSIGSGIAMGDKVLAIGSDDRYVFIYRYMPFSSGWSYVFDTSFCVCGCDPNAVTGNVTVPCNVIAVPQDGSMVVVADMTPAYGTTVVSVGSLYVYSSTVTGDTASWTVQQSLSIDSSTCASLAGLSNYRYPSLYPYPSFPKPLSLQAYLI